MKLLRLIFEFFNRNRIPAIVITAVYILVMFVANNFFGAYRYTVYTRTVFTSTETENSFYCMPNTSTEEMMNMDSDDPWGDYINRLESEAKKYKAYVPFTTAKNFFVSFNSRQIKSYIYSEEMIEKYRLALKAGSWDDVGDTGDCFNVIASGEHFNYLNVGDTAELELEDYVRETTVKVKIKIVGKLASPYIVPAFTSSGTDRSADDLYQSLSNGFIFPESDRFTKLLNDTGNAPSTAENFMAAYSSDASEAEKEEYLDFFTKRFNVANYEEILKNSNKTIAHEFRIKLPMPMFLMAITTIALISLSVLFVNKKLREHSIYYLCGCSRAKSYLIISCAIGLMGLIGGLVNMLFIYSYDYLVGSGLLSSGDAIYDGKTMLFTLTYAVLVSLISIVISAAVFRKSSPIEIYRKYEN